MNSTQSKPAHSYLDALELAELLGISVQAVFNRVRRQPWLLPPRAVLYDQQLLRWRQDIVERWLVTRS
jgi:predicted DNA-binding transcriptional regulator AlpA